MIDPNLSIEAAKKAALFSEEMTRFFVELQASLIKQVEEQKLKAAPRAEEVLGADAAPRAEAVPACGALLASEFYLRRARDVGESG